MGNLLQNAWESLYGGYAATSSTAGAIVTLSYGNDYYQYQYPAQALQQQIGKIGPADILEGDYRYKKPVHPDMGWLDKRIDEMRVKL